MEQNNQNKHTIFKIHFSRFVAVVLPLPYVNVFMMQKKNTTRKLHKSNNKMRKWIKFFWDMEPDTYKNLHHFIHHSNASSNVFQQTSIGSHYYCYYIYNSLNNNVAVWCIQEYHSSSYGKWMLVIETVSPSIQQKASCKKDKWCICC